ncbi:hypothetical protein Scep_014068 [Stephania cephalantha]|uniref:Uncharacterized protein n=1 Tax=Stephania cephalantha TaxID=152367 RepID=A0AAP0J2K6_9MAGN
MAVANAYPVFKRMQVRASPCATPACVSLTPVNASLSQKDETGSEPLGGACSHSGWRPPTASNRKDKQKIHTQASGLASSRRPRKGVLQDKASHVVEHHERDLTIARGQTEGEVSESSDDSLGNEETEEGNADWFAGVVNGVEGILNCHCDINLPTSSSPIPRVFAQVMLANNPETHFRVFAEDSREIQITLESLVTHVTSLSDDVKEQELIHAHQQKIESCHCSKQGGGELSIVKPQAESTNGAQN